MKDTSEDLLGAGYNLDVLTDSVKAADFKAKNEAAMQGRREIQSSNWEDMVKGGEEGFRKVASDRGFLENYEAANPLIGGDQLRRRLIRDLFVQDVTGATGEELATGVPRLQVAKSLFNLDDASPDAFDAALDGFVTERITFRENAKKIYELSSRAALNGTPWADTVAEAAKIAGGDLTRYQDVFNKGRSDLFQLLRPQDIQVVNQLWAATGRLEDKETKDTAGGSLGTSLAEYEAMTPDQRKAVMTGIAMRAEAEGEDIDGTFNRIGAALRSGSTDIVSGLVSSDLRNEATILEDVVKSGRVLSTVAPITRENFTEVSGSLGRLEASDLSSNERTRPLTEAEKSVIINQSQTIKGQARFLQDLRSAGINAKEYRQKATQGGWFFGDSLENTIVNLAESVPSMAVTAIPVAGPVMMATSYTEQERARLEAMFPQADADAIELQAVTVGAWMAGADIVQNKLFASKVPALNAAMLKLGKPGGVALFATRAVTTGVLETAQEVGQDIGSPIIQSIASALNEDIKGPNWDEWMDQEANALGDIFRVSMLMGIVGGAGSTISDYMDGSKLRETLMDRRMLALNGIDPSDIDEIAKTADKNPAAAAQLLQGAQATTPADVRMKNAQEAFQREEVETASTTLREAGIPEMIQRDDGKVIVQYNDGVTNDRIFDTPDQAKADMDSVVTGQQVEMARVNRELIAELEGSYNRTIGPTTIEQGAVRSSSLSEAIQTGETTVEIGRQRARIYLRSAKDQMGITDPTDDAQIDSILGRLMIQGASRNQYAEGMTTMVLQIRDGAKPTVVFEEAIEGFGKWMIEKGGVTPDKMYGWIRETEGKVGMQILPENFMELSPDLMFQEIIEGWSRIGVAHATGRIQDSQLSQQIKDFFKAIRQMIADVLALAVKVREYTDSKDIDPDFKMWLDRAAGFDTEGEIANQQSAAQAEVNGMIGETFAVSPDQDTAYLSAVESGDMETAQQMVDEAAKAAGYDAARPMFHGTTHEFDVFTKDRANIENDFGKGYYFTNTDADVDANYAGVGPDLTNRIEQMAERMESNDDLEYDEAKAKARELLVGTGPKTLNVYLNLKNPVRIGGGNETFFDVTEEYDEGLDEYGEQTGLLVDFTNALRDVAAEFEESDGDQAAGFLMEAAMDNGGISANEMVKMLKENEESGINYATDENGDLASSEIIREAFERMGFDGIEDFTVDEKFGSSRKLGQKMSGVDADTHHSIAFHANQIKSAQPATKDRKGNVIPLSQRFNPDDNRISYAVTSQADPISASLDNFKKNPEAFVKFANAAKVAVADVRRRYTKKALESNERQRDFDQYRDLAKLEAIARVLPGEIRGVLTSSFRKTAELKTTKAREAYIASLLPKVEQAIEKNLQKTLRKEIKELLKQGSFKKNASKTRDGTIGGAGHAIFEEAKRAIKITDTADSSALQQADELADKLRDQMEGNVTDEQLEELDGRIAAIELFSDYANADSARLTEAWNLLNGVYAQGRAERLAVLKARKDQRQQRVQAVLRGLNREGPISDAQRNAAKQKFSKFWTKFNEGILQAVVSGSQKIRRLSEVTDDPGVKAVAEEMEAAALEAELSEQDANEADTVALSQAMRRIFGAKTEYGVSKKLRELTTPEIAPVEKAEGKSSDKTIKVPMRFAEAIASGQTTGWETKSGKRTDLTPDQISELQDKLDDFDPEDQEGVRSIEVTEAGNPGDRQTIGEISQLEGLQLWLTMRQPDQFSKLEAMGYDQQTMDQLEAWLKPEAKALGLWMVDRIGNEAFTIDQLHRSEKGVGLRLVENYFPVRNDVSGADNTGLSIDGKSQHTGKSVSSLKERVKNNAPPAYVNAVAVFLANRAQVNFWKSHVTFLREWGGVVRDESFAAAVKNRMGETYYKSLQTTFRRIEGGGALNAASLMDWQKIVRKMTSNFALATLGGRLSTLAINTTAALNPLLEIPASELVKGLGDLLNRPESLRDAFNSPALQRRWKTGGSYEAQLARAQGISTNPVVAQLGAAAQIPVSWITKVDTGSQVIGAAIAWEYTRKQGVAAGLTEELARAEADKKVERIFLRAAQPTTRLAKSELELNAAENPLAALFTLFTSEPRKNIAIGYLAARELLTGKGNYGRAMAAQQLFTVLLVQTTAAYLIRSLYASLVTAKDEEDEDFGDRFVKRLDPKAFAYSLATEHLKSVPIAGEIYNTAMAGILDQPSFDSSPNPLNRVTQKGWSFADKLADDKPLTREQAIDGGIDLAQSLGSILPGGQIFAQSANVAEAVEGILSSNVQETLSDDDRIRRIKSRFSKMESEYTKEHGPLKGEDGKIDKEKQAARNSVLSDALKLELLPLTPELRDKALKEIGASKTVVKEAGFEVPE